LMSGVQHYVGTFWEILDEPGKRFAIEFYRALMDGATTGEAMQQARHALIKAYGEDTIVWASYMLYGDPGFSYCDFAEESEAAAADAEIQAPAAAGGIRSSADDSVMFGSAAAPATDYKPLIMGLSLVFLIAIAFFFFMNRGPEKTALEKDPYLQSYVLLQSQKIQAARNGFGGLDDDDPRKHEGLAAVMFELGNFAKARELCQKTLQTAPRNRYARVIQGNMFFSEDKLDEALQEYEACAATKGGIAWQQAEALNGIARIHSSRGDDQKALQYYGQAAGLHTGSSTIQTNYGLAMQRTGNNAAALASLKQASAANPSDRYAAAMLAATRKKQKAEADQARQSRIDTLVNDLAVSFKKGTAPQQQGDLWTTGPLTVSFIDFRAKGAPSAREGEDDFFLLRMNALLQEQGGIQIVEREILDKLLAELKLSSTDLVNPDTAVRLGRIMAARIIATGSIMRFGADIQVSFRLTDTETTAMKGAIAESGKDLDQLAETISKTIGAKLKKSYPVRGKIAAVENDEIILNIGSVSGVQTGMQFTIFAEGQTRSGKLRLKPVGTITIASVAEDEAYAPVPDRITGLQAKMRVEQLTN
ncbi:MAG: CHAT domain-containing protein, partial [Deltaproteobacteria bacterium]|nr:CHAT domain-containing protein [Deltaproteobacteria bacterium]